MYIYIYIFTHFLNYGGEKSKSMMRCDKYDKIRPNEPMNVFNALNNNNSKSISSCLLFYV